MSRIKGRYVDGTSIKDDRWLDPVTGTLYYNEHGASYAHSRFVQQTNGTWVNGPYIWQQDVVPADWFVQMRNPNQSADPYFTDGPYTEQRARSRAQGLAAKYPKNKYAVYQVLPGNSVSVVPPTPPQPEVIWS